MGSMAEALRARSLLGAPTNMGVLVGESPAGPNTPGLLGVEDLEAGSMGET